MADNKYLDLSGLSIYDSKIKVYISGSISNLSEQVDELDDKVTALNGAIIYLGKIEKHTSEVTQELLNERVEELGYTESKIGYTIVDLDANDWVYSEDDLWVNIGYYEVTKATDTTLGIVKGGSLIKVNSDGELYVNSLGSYVSGNSMGLLGSLSVSKGISAARGYFSVGNSGDVYTPYLSVGTITGTGNITTSGTLSAARGKFTVDSSGIITGSGINIKSANGVNMAYINTNGSIKGSTISLGTGSQFTVDNGGNIKGSSLSLGTGSQFTVNTSGSLSIGTGSQFTVSTSGYISGQQLKLAYEGITISGYGTVATYLSGGGIYMNGDQIITLNGSNSYISNPNSFTISGGGINLNATGILKSIIIKGSRNDINITEGNQISWSHGSLSDAYYQHYSWIDFGTGYITGSYFKINSAGISIGTGSQFTVDNNGNINGSSLSIGTGSQFVANSEEFKFKSVFGVTGGGITIGSGVNIIGNLEGYNFKINNVNNDSDSYFQVGGSNGLKMDYWSISGTCFNLSGGGLMLMGNGAGHIMIGEHYSTKGIYISANDDITPVIQIKGNNILDENGSRIDSQYLTGQLGSGVTFTGLSTTQVNELKTLLGL